MHIRTISDDELDGFIALTEEAFGELPPEVEADAAVLRGSVELDRTRAAFDGDRQVGSSAAFSMRVSVPGGSVPMAGISWVGVAPGYRRRGVLRAMMMELLGQARERGEPLAGLHASEWPIYTRFGFGMAAAHATLQVTLDGVGLRPGVAGDEAEAVGAVDEEAAADALPAVAQVHGAIAARRGGVAYRTPNRWRMVLHEFAADRTELGRRHCALFRAGGVVEGYALYHFKGDWSVDGLPTGKITVVELVGATSRATAALWRHVLSTDLAARLEAHWRPVDDVLPLLLADPRRARLSVRDGLFLRLLDLPAAFAGRTAGASGSVRISLRDRLVDANEGTWRISTPDGAGGELQCVRQDGSAGQLRGDVAALSACYLGGESALRLLDAGLLDGDVGAASLLDRMLASGPAPWPIGEF